MLPGKWPHAKRTVARQSYQCCSSLPAACLCAIVRAHAHSVSRYAGPEQVAAAVARASTPYKPSRPVPASALAGIVDLDSMWAQATAADMRTLAGAAVVQGGSVQQVPSNSTDCRAYMLQYEFSLRLMPERAPLRDVFDALQLAGTCGVTPPGLQGDAEGSSIFVQPLILSAHALSATCAVGPFYVDPLHGDDGNSGSITQPFATVARGMSATRTGGSAPRSLPACVVLRAGVHYLQSTVTLGPQDSSLIITGYEGEMAWVSGGVPLPALNWTSYNTSGGANIWVATVPAAVPIAAMPGLNTVDTSNLAVPPTRLWRAKYPNYDQEQFKGSLPGMREVVQWVKPGLFAVPTFLYKDLAALGLKNDSTMTQYNVYGAGRGGPCAHWDNDESMWAYVCGNASAGGWEFVEHTLATTGQLGFPIGLYVNLSLLPNAAGWSKPPSDPSDWSNAPTLTVWHNQGWFQAAFAVTGLDGRAGFLNLTADGVWPAGGWQGGRTMQPADSRNMSVAAPMGSGPWYVSNVFQELDAPGEYFFDPISRSLYLYYNASAGTPPPPTLGLVVSQLEVFFNLTGTPATPVTDVQFAGLAFRDQRTAQLDRWIDPSGGDWGLRRAGLLHFEGTERTNVSGCTFYRTDANAVFLAAYNRNVSVVDSEFAFTGFSAVVTFGSTLQDDGTGGEQPWGTLIAYNKVHEIGTYQLQSSAWFTSRSALTRAEGNVVFNIPRAAININDGFGGGNNITACSIFNTCRQSSDHGPINTWDRMPFLTTIRSGGSEASYALALSETSHSMLIANYGASQGEDNDDGSSWYNTHDNFFYDAAGFKMDYGGHDSLFHDNVIIASSGQNCLGTASFVAGHADQVYNNKCVVYGTERVDDLFENCDKDLGPGMEPVHGYNNSFYTANGNASATCDCCGLRPLAQLPAGLEDNFQALGLPTGDQVIAWARDKLNLPASTP